MLQDIQHITVLALGGKNVLVFVKRPAQGGGRVSLRQPELDMVSRVMKTARQINTDITSVTGMTWSPPGQPVVTRIRTAPACLIKQDRFGKGIGIIEIRRGTTYRRVRSTARPAAGHTAGDNKHKHADKPDRIAKSFFHFVLPPFMVQCFVSQYMRGRRKKINFRYDGYAPWRGILLVLEGVFTMRLAGRRRAVPQQALRTPAPNRFPTGGPHLKIISFLPLHVPNERLSGWKAPVSGRPRDCPSRTEYNPKGGY